MNGIEKITARILADAETECASIRSAGEAQVAEIRAANDAKAQELYWSLVREGVKDTEQRVGRMGRTAALEAKKSVLTMKQEMVSSAFDRAREKICGMPDEEYIAFCAGLAAKAASTGMEEIVLNESDKAKCGKQIAAAANELLDKRGLLGKLTVSELTRPMSGGLILKQGDIEVNCTVDTLLELSRGELAARVAEVLFES